jgi:hypothetical protein
VCVPPHRNLRRRHGGCDGGCEGGKQLVAKSTKRLI